MKKELKAWINFYLKGLVLGFNLYQTLTILNLSMQLFSNNEQTF
jgi:hypothetical protein